MLSCIQLFATLRAVACQALLSMGFSRQRYWSGLPCLPPGHLPDPGIKPTSLKSPALAGGFFTTSTTWEAPTNIIILNNDLILHFLLFFYHSFLKSCSALGNLLKQNASTATNLQLSLFAVSPQMSAFPRMFLCLLSPASHTQLPLPDFCLFILPSLQIQRRKAKKCVDVRGGQRERLVTSQGVRLEVGGSQ